MLTFQRKTVLFLYHTLFCVFLYAILKNADMAELADAPDLGSGGAIHAGSIPVIRTKAKAADFGRFCRLKPLQILYFCPEKS
jgi:hypothetical protein